MASTTPVAEITRQDLEDIPILPPQATVITKLKHLSSYNWIEASTPTIAVPGSPALWSVPKVPRRLPKDSGFVYIAQNAARHPESPLEPLFRALYITNPSFDLGSVDIVTDRNNIRKLLSFINPSSSRNGLEPFTISVEVSNNTVIFCRQETKTHEFVGPNEFRGYGHEFEKAYTKSQVSDSTGHHRIISYRFGDLNFVVRYETDGYVATSAGSSANKSLEHDNLTSALDSLSLSPTASHSPTTLAGSKLAIIRAGQTVPLESTLEIKTRVSHKRLGISDVAPQLWISQTPKLVRAHHQKGLFETPVVEDVSQDIVRWEQANQKDLERLAALINRILVVAKEIGATMVI